MDIRTRTLEGEFVRLEPLSMDHLEGLSRIGCVEELWRWTTVKVLDADAMRLYIDAALKLQAEGTSVAFATVDRSSGSLAGSTRFLNISREHRRVEIGSTWVAPSWQRTAINSEAKYLMLRHAFEAWCCIRVELKTNAKNMKSRNAILRIGAREEGTLRRHMINSDGSVRDTVYFSVIDGEWPAVKAALERRLRAVGMNLPGDML